MLYALVITVAAGVALLLFLGAGATFARRAVDAAGRGESPFGRWQFRPTPLGAVLLLLVPLAGLLLWRVFPVFLLLPVVIPLVWRWRGRAMFRRTRRPRDERKDDAIEGRYRPLDDQ